MLLSLVVIFTQSIQLSKIVERLTCRYRALRRLKHSCSRFKLRLCRVSTLSRFRLFLVRERNGGADRDRTDDILLAKQALSQLSYSPISISISDSSIKVVGLGRFELPTSPLSGVRSNQLSYRPGTAPMLDCIESHAALLLKRVTRDSKSSSLEKVSRTQLNVRSSYAASDHRC